MPFLVARHRGDDMRHSSEGRAPIRVRRRAVQIRLNQVPIDAAWTLDAPKRPAEKIRDLDRFAVEVKPGEPATLRIKEERTERQQIALARLDDNDIQFYQNTKVVGERAKATLAEIVRRKREFQQVAASRQQREQRIRQIGEDQNRARQNMDRLDHASKLYKSRIKKLTTQEEEVVKLNEEIASLTEPSANCEESAPGPRRHRGQKWPRTIRSVTGTTRVAVASKLLAFLRHPTGPKRSAMRTNTGSSAVLLLACGASLALAQPPAPADYDRHRENVAQMKQVLAGLESDEKKFERLADAMRRESNADLRCNLLALAATRPGPAQESFLIGLLQSDGDWTVRSEAATLLGRFGSVAAIAPLAKAAATDAVTIGTRGCMVSEGTARRVAIFALAELGRRLPTSANAITEEVRRLPEANDADKRLLNESLGDARRQALFQLTQDRALLGPFFERLKSKDAKTRQTGVVAFRFLYLSEAPRELVELARDPSLQVRGWVVLVLGEIGDAKTVPVLMAIAKDASLDRGTRCNAIGSLGRMRAIAAQSLLESLLSDEDLKVNAAIALSQITERRHPLVPGGYGGPDWPRKSRQ
jgi:HEAT repeat protein